MLAHLLADTASDSNRLATMFRLFLVAALIITPFAAITIRRILVDRHERRWTATDNDTAATDPSNASASSASDPTGSAHDLARVVSQIDDAATILGEDRGDAPEEVTVELPRDPTLDGRPVDDAVAGSLIADAASRSGLAATRDDSTSPARLVLRRRN